MSAGTVILWRHGRTEFNATSRLQGTIDVPLDEVGRWQVEQAALDPVSYTHLTLPTNREV